MSKASFKFHGAMMEKSTPQDGTLTIDRSTGVIEVRPKHSRRAYGFTLAEIASMIVQMNLKAEAHAAHEAKRKGGG